MSRKPSNEEYNKIRRNIVKKLYSSKCFQKGHLLFERLQSGTPGHLLGFIREVLDDLMKEGLVLYYGRTKHGDAYQLNINELDKIEKIIFEN
ncbi:hypothetical protein HZA97_03780 [Candidatus Woesearchaeota archaeon]|nr:hypothetical protein [Candidatus Woesearchaeota archaeon]